MRTACANDPSRGTLSALLPVGDTLRSRHGTLP